MHLNDLKPILNKYQRDLIDKVLSREKLVTVQTASCLLGVSERRVYDLCSQRVLDFINNPFRKICRSSLLRYILSKHGYHNIDVE